jgi:hypothetical protein
MQAPSASRFAEVLAGALALSAEDQVRLRTVLDRLTEGSPCAAAARCGAPAQGADLDLPTQETLEHWLAQIAREPAWNQLLLLDEALTTADSELETSALQAARTGLLQANPATAVRQAVFALACQHPIAVCFGVAGLALAVFGLVRVLLRIVF